MLGSALICTLQCLMTGLLTCLSVSPEDSKYLKGREGLPLIQWSTQATEEGEEEDAKMTGGGEGRARLHNQRQPSKQCFSNYGWQPISGPGDRIKEP